MDDEHTEAFKKQVIERLLTHGYHVIVLTHMQLLANDVESLYRNRGAVLYKMSHYSRSGPSIDWKGPQLVRLLESVRRNKDGNEQYRQQATLNLRISSSGLPKTCIRHKLAARFQDVTKTATGAS